MQEIKAVYEWSHLFNELDHLISPKLLQQNPMENKNADLLFTRILGQPGMKNAERWLDSSECWICNKHNKLTLQMNEAKAVIDEGFKEIMQLSEVINLDSENPTP